MKVRPVAINSWKSISVMNELPLKLFPFLPRPVFDALFIFIGCKSLSSRCCYSSRYLLLLSLICFKIETRELSLRKCLVLKIMLDQLWVQSVVDFIIRHSDITLAWVYTHLLLDSLVRSLASVVCVAELSGNLTIFKVDVWSSPLLCVFSIIKYHLDLFCNSICLFYIDLTLDCLGVKAMQRVAKPLNQAIEVCRF